MPTKKPISKTRKSVSKRFKKTGSGKFKRYRQGKRHLLRKKNHKRKMRLRSHTYVSNADEAAVKENLPFS